MSGSSGYISRGLPACRVPRMPRMFLTEVSTMPGKGHLRLYLWCLVSIIGGCKAQWCPELCHCDFTSLSQGLVNCSYSPIHALPLDKPLPLNTTVLDLRYAGLSEIPRHAFSQTENLKVLYVGGNSITHFYEDSFAGLWNLEHLDLSPLHLYTNFDNETFPVSLFHDLAQLKVLIFGKMSVTAEVQNGYLDQTLAPLHRLQQVFFPGLPRRNLVLGPGYRNLTSLKTVVFHGHGSVVQVHLRKHSFAMVKNCPIERLAFIRCGLATVEYGTMSSFPQLKTLDIEEASFTSYREVENFICDLNNTSIEVLRMNNIFSWVMRKPEDNQWIVRAKTFHCLKSKKLKSLELLGDKILKIESEIAPFLRHLVYLDLSGNDVLNFLENETQANGWKKILVDSQKLSNIRLFRMDYNVYRTIMVNAQDGPSNSFWYGHPKLPLEPAKHVSPLEKVHQGPIQNFPEGPILKVGLPENLEFWSSSWWGSGDNKLLQCDFLHGSIYFFPNKLRYLKIEDLNLNLNLNKFCPLPVIYGLDRLEYLDISYNGVNFLPKKFFDNFISLKYLYLKDNNLGPLIAKRVLHPIQLPHLEILDLSVNKIGTIPKDFFGYLVSLKRLDLSDNRISTVSFTMANLLSIEYIDISSNQLIYLATSELDHIWKMNASRLEFALNMSNNPIDCNFCDGIGLLHLIIDTNLTTIFSDDSTCYMNGSKKSLESNLSILERGCDSFPSNQWLYLVFLAVPCCLIVAYICRWNIKYHFFLLRRHFRKRGVIKATPGHVYASYDDNDYQWVTHVLLRHLEDENQLNVIIDQRDFVGGASLSEAIVEAVENSRKTVLVLSESYVLNPWCEFEFQMSLARGYQSIIPVMFRPVPFDAMTKSLRKYIKARGYIKWTENPDGQRLFWKRLSDAIFNQNYKLGHPQED